MTNTAHILADIQGLFGETGVTGQRDTVVYEIERKNGNVGDVCV